MTESESWRVKYTRTEIETRQLRELLDSKVHEIDGLRERLAYYSQVELQLNLVKQEKATLEHNIDVNNNEIESLKGENTRLERIVGERNKDIDHLKDKVSILVELESRLKFITSQLDELSAVNSDYEQEIIELKARK